MPATEMIVGVIGGMGPAATARFYLRLTELTRAERDQDHLHIVIDSNAATPDRTACIEAGDTAPLLAALRGSVRRLEAAGAELLVMPCNTAHVVHEQLAAATTAPLLHIADETAAALSAGGWQRPALLATRGTLATGLYQSRCQAPPMLPDDGQADRIHRAIDRIKAGRPAEALTELERVQQELRATGADALVLGCTDLATVLGPPNALLPVVDSTDVLALATLREAGRQA